MFLACNSPFKCCQWQTKRFNKPSRQRYLYLYVPTPASSTRFGTHKNLNVHLDGNPNVGWMCSWNEIKITKNVHSNVQMLSGSQKRLNKFTEQEYVFLYVPITASQMRNEIEQRPNRKFNVKLIGYVNVHLHENSDVAKWIQTITKNMCCKCLPIVYHVQI